MNLISKFSYVIKGHGGGLLALLVLSAGISFTITFVDPIAMKLLIDRGLGERDLTLFCVVIGVVVLLTVAAASLKLVEALWTQRLKNRISAEINERMFESFHGLPYQNVLAEGDGYFVSRIYDEPKKTAEVVVTAIQLTVTHVVALVTALSISIYLSWRVTLVLALVVPVLYMLSRRFGRKIVRESKLENESEADFRRDLSRSLHAFTTTTLFDQRMRVADSILASLQRSFAALYLRVKSAAMYRTASGLSMAMAESAVLAVAAMDVFMGNLTIGGMLAYMAGFWKIMNGASGLIALFPEYARASGYIERLQEFEQWRQRSTDDPEPTASLPIHIEQLNFRYGEQPVLQSFDLKVSLGEKVLIIGRNGTGKTTLALILSGFFQAQAQRLEAPSMHRVSAMMPPLKFYFPSLREHLDLERLDEQKRGLALAMLGDLNLHAKLDQDPESFSEGERRKAYLVTCLLKDADLYILDEPLAAVDEQSKDMIMDWIIRRTQGRMLVVIMHGDERFHPRFDQLLHLLSDLDLPGGLMSQSGSSSPAVTAEA